MTAIMNATGDSHTPFTCNTTGLIANMILDPLFIFGFGPIPHKCHGCCYCNNPCTGGCFLCLPYRIHQSDIVLNHVNYSRFRFAFIILIFSKSVSLWD